MVANQACCACGGGIDLTGVVLLDSNSPSRDLTLRGLTVRFVTSARIILANSRVGIHDSNFTGNGSIEFVKGNDLHGLKQADIFANSFADVRLRFGDIRSSEVRLRNNKGAEYTAIVGAPEQCVWTKWTSFNSSKLPTGKELSNDAFADALQSKTTFTQNEWDKFGIQGLHVDTFVKSGASYFQPTARTAACKDWDERAICKQSQLLGNVQCFCEESLSSKQATLNKGNLCPCNKNEIFDDEKKCRVFAMKASVQSATLATVIYKPNIHLLDLPTAQQSMIDIAPAADYEVSVSVTVAPPSPWLVLGKVETNWARCTGTITCHARKLSVGFNVSDKPDMDMLEALLMLTGVADQIKETNASIRVSAEVRATPSLEKSKFIMPSEVTEGEAVTMKIEEFDDDDLPFVKDRGGIIQLTVQKPDRSKMKKTSIFHSGSFIIESLVPVAGDYRVWMDSVFGFKPNQSIELPHGEISTQTHRQETRRSG